MSDWTASVFPADWAPGYARLERGGGDFASLFTVEELFEAFLAAESARDHGEPGPGVSYFNYELEPRVFSRQRGEPTPTSHLPKRSDGSFEGYADRIRKELSTAHYCLRLTEMHAYAAPVVWKRLCSRLLPLEAKMRSLDPKPRTVKTTVFVGHYQYTPFGVHVDPYPQIQCVITGERSALFWSSEYWAPLGGDGSPSRLAPFDHLAAADRITMSKGDAVYWAAQVEHAFSSSGGFAVALTISFPEVNPPDSEIETLRRRSAHHFLNVPAVAADHLVTGCSRFRGAPLFPIELLHHQDRRALLIGGGAVLDLEELSPSILQPFVNRVNDRSQTFGVEEVAKDLGVGMDDARALIEALARCHCIDVDGVV